MGRLVSPGNPVREVHTDPGKPGIFFSNKVISAGGAGLYGRFGVVPVPRGSWEVLLWRFLGQSFHGGAFPAPLQLIWAFMIYPTDKSGDLSQTKHL